MGAFLVFPDSSRNEVHVARVLGVTKEIFEYLQRVAIVEH